MIFKDLIRQLLYSNSLISQRIRWLAGIFVVMVVFIILFKLIPVSDVIHILRYAKWDYLLLSLLLAFLSLIMTSLEMVLVTRHQLIHHSFINILQINLAVIFYTQFVPNSLIASGIRWFRLANPGGKRAESLAALVFFRSLDTFLAFAFALIFWFLSQRRVSNTSINTITLILSIILIPLIWFIITRKSVFVYKWLKTHWAKFLENPFWLPFSKRFEKFLVALSVYSNFSVTSFLLAFSAGTFSLVFSVCSTMVLARAVGIQIGFFEMGWIQVLITIATQLPFSVGGGVGIREVTLVTLLNTYGVSGEKALALSFMLFIRVLLIALFGGGVELIRHLNMRPFGS